VSDRQEDKRQGGVVVSDRRRTKYRATSRCRSVCQLFETVDDHSEISLPRILHTIAQRRLQCRPLLLLPLLLVVVTTTTTTTTV